MNISVIICTRNHAESLRFTLESIGRAVVPPDWTLEVLVIDNGSTDQTRAVVEASALPNGGRVHYHLESRPGQCHARNTGLEKASGEIILFTDDDVRVPLNWVVEMSRPLAENRADAVAGGVVLPPRIAFATCKYPLCNLRGWFAVSDYLNPDAPEYMIGANMGFHRRVLQQVPGFDTELGPGALGFEDETLFSKQLVRAGFRLTGALDVAVEHHFDLGRTTRDALLDAARRRGRCQAYLFHHWKHGHARRNSLQIVRGKLKRFGFALARAIAPGRQQEISLQELEAEKQLAFSEEYAVQRNRPRRYEQYGLVLLNLNASGNARPVDRAK